MMIHFSDLSYDFVVREGDLDLRLKFVRFLGEPEGDYTLPNENDTCKSVALMKKQVKTLLVEALMKFSQGRGKRKVRPYGAKAARSKSHFKKISSSALATTLAVAYPFIVDDKSTWEEKRKTAIYPMTSLWPKGVVKSFVHYGETVRKQRDNLFKGYESAGGKYSTVNQEDDEDEDEDEGDEAVAEDDEESDSADIYSVF